MLPPEKLARLNALAKKSKTEGLSPEEQKEQQALRQQYLETFRKTFRNHLESITVVDKDSASPKKLN